MFVCWSVLSLCAYVVEVKRVRWCAQLRHSGIIDLLKVQCVH